MYAALLLSLATLLGPHADADCAAWTHVHPMSPHARHLLNTAIRRSPLVRDLLDEIERSDVIVLFMLSIEPATESRRPYLRFLTSTEASRYVVLQMYTLSEPPVAQIPMLAHELRHALEVAAAPDVRDQAGYSRLFARIGWTVAPKRFETDAARTTERLVRRELGTRAVPSQPGRTPGS